MAGSGVLVACHSLNPGSHSRIQAWGLEQAIADSVWAGMAVTEERRKKVCGVAGAVSQDRELQVVLALVEEASRTAGLYAEVHDRPNVAI